MTGYFASRFNDLLDTKTLPVAEVVSATAVIEGVESQDVRLRKIQYMDVVSDTRPVGRVVVVTKHAHTLALTQRDLQNNWDQMQLG